MSVHNYVLEYDPDRTMISYRAEINFEILQDGKLDRIGNWSKSTGITVAPGKQVLPAKRYFRIGTTEVNSYGNFTVQL